MPEFCRRDDSCDGGAKQLMWGWRCGAGDVGLAILGRMAAHWRSRGACRQLATLAIVC
jgi:hypothetical protein